MELLVSQATANESGNLHTSAPPRVIVAFDQLTDEEQR